MTNAMMKEQETNGILGFVSMWPELGRRMEVGFSDLKVDMETVVQHLKTNNITVSVMTFTSQFSFLGDFIRIDHLLTDSISNIRNKSL